MTGMSLDSAKKIASGRIPGNKFLEKLQQVVQRVEISQVQEFDDTPSPIEEEPTEDQLSIRRESAKKPPDPIIEEFNKLDAMHPKIGTPEWLRLRELSDMLLKRENTG